MRFTLDHNWELLCVGWQQLQKKHYDCHVVYLEVCFISVFEVAALTIVN